MPGIPSSVHPIAGAPTAIAAFVGWATQGPTDGAILVRTWLEFEQQFGGFDPRFYLGYAVSHFFANGGQQAYIVRLASDGGSTPTASAAVMIGVLYWTPCRSSISLPCPARPIPA